MSSLKLSKVDVLPGVLSPSTLYITKGPEINSVVFYVTDKNGSIAYRTMSREDLIDALTNLRAEEDAADGYVGLTGFKLNVMNALGSIKSWITTSATAARTWVMPDKSGTVALTDDIPTSLPASDVSAWAKEATKPAYTIDEISDIASWVKQETKPSYTLSELGAQATLVSNENIKTVNGESILGTGDLTVTGGLVATAIKIDSYAASVDELVRVNSSGGSFNVTAPSNPVDGDKFAVFDVAGFCSLHPVTILVSGDHTVQLDVTGMLIDVDGAYVYMLFNAANGNWGLAETPTAMSVNGITDYVDTPLEYTYTGIMTVPPVGYQTAAMLPSPTGKQRFASVVLSSANYGLTTIAFPNLEFVQLIAVNGIMPALISINCPLLARITSNSTFNGHPSLVEINMPSLIYIGGSIGTNGCTNLTVLGYASLQTIGGNFSPNNLASITAFNFPALKKIIGGFAPATVPLLTTFNFPELEYVGATFSTVGLNSLITLSCPKLKVVGGTFSPGSIPELTIISVPLLEFAFGIAMSSLPKLTTVNLASLKRCDGLLYITNCDVVTSIDLSSLETVVGAMYLSVMLNLTDLSLPSLKSIDGNFTVIAGLNQVSVDGLLVKLASLDGTLGTTAYSNKIISIEASNSPPSETGLAAKAILITRGCTVTTN